MFPFKRDRTLLDYCCSFLPPLRPIFPCLRKSWQISNRVKRKKKFLFIDAWMTSWTDRKVQRAGREAQTPTECTCIMHIYFQSHMHRKTSTRKHTIPRALPKHCLTWQIRTCASLPVFDIAAICHISVGASRGFTSWEIKPKRTNMSSPSLPLPALSLFPVFLRWVLSNEAGKGSRSQHHMLHNSQSPAVIAEASIKDSATTSMDLLWMKQGLMVSNERFSVLFSYPICWIWHWLSKTT